ncbi:MAG TPA: adenylosuccinate lyase [Chloroflexi bacterium]|nr:adenylosuccinate lyase [Chloroflexota bacterium]
MSALTALSPLDGRYAQKVAELSPCFSEFALLKYRLLVEVEWFIDLSEAPAIAELRPLTLVESNFLRSLVTRFNQIEAAEVKAIERITNHDVKAVEYYLKQKLAGTSLASLSEFIHFACTSEDINNLAHALMLKQGVGEIWLDAARQTIDAIDALAQRYKTTPMLAHTHGQPASPTTVGKEMAVFGHRLRRQWRQIQSQEYLGKINGATGNFNAHQFAYPAVDWPQFAQAFVEDKLALTYNPLTTQIESHDYMAELFQAMIRFNTIVLDFDRDVWLYISRGYFKEQLVAGEVGSSTMPHKVNPIDFENSEGNMGLSNALLSFMAHKLPVSRWQRDLSDSTVIRNMGTAVGYSLLALKSTLKGIGKLLVNEDLLQTDLDNTWEVLTEAVQTVMRKAGIENSYEQLKTISRGQRITQAALIEFLQELPVPEDDKTRLLRLSPANYIGQAGNLASLGWD